MNDDSIHKVFNLKNVTLQIKLDILDVFLGRRPGARIFCYLQDQANYIAEELVSLGIKISVARGLISQNANSTNIVRDYIDTESEHLEELIPFYISRNQDYADRLRAADETKNDLIFGTMLGYPKCCIDRVVDIGHVPSIVEAFHYLANNKEFNVWAWPVAMIGDASLLVHFPCSKDCVQSIDLSHYHYKLILDYAPITILNRVKKYHNSSYSICNGVITLQSGALFVSPQNSLDEIF
jgi:hypothetical protein